MDSLTEKKWFVYIGDRHEGPFSLEEIQGKMTEGLVTDGSYVWTEGMQDWKPMTEIPDFAAILNPNASAAGPSATPVYTPETPIAAPEEGAGPSVAVASMISEEKTGEMDASEMRQTQSVGAEAAVAPEKKRRRLSLSISPKLVKLIFLLIILGGLGKAYLSGYLNPDSPALQAGIEKAADYSRPYLLLLSEKVPFLAQWISPIPSLPDVSPEEFEELKFAARDKVETSGIRVSIALSRADTLSPSFYLASNLPDGAQFHIFIVGKGDTLLNQLSFGTQADVTIMKKMGKTIGIRYSDGKPIPRGDYTLYVSPSESQPPQIKTQLAAAPSLTVTLPADLPKNTKIIALKTFFLGGTKDAIYLGRLKEYHTKLQVKATNEINEIMQFTATLGTQLESTKTKFLLLRKGKVSAKQKKLWEIFHNEWIGLESHLDQIFTRWTPETVQNEYFYGVLYTLTQQAGQEVGKVHGFHNAFFTGVQDLKTFDIQLGAALSAADSAISFLKSKTDQARNLQPTLNGMPRRDGL